MIQNQNAAGQNHGKNNGNLCNTGTADNADADGPEQEHQIHGVFDSGAEPDNGKRTHHTQGNHDTGLHGENQRRGDRRDTCQRNVEVLGVEGLSGDKPVNQEDIQRQYAGYGHSGQNCLCGKL